MKTNDTIEDTWTLVSWAHTTYIQQMTKYHKAAQGEIRKHRQKMTKSVIWQTMKYYTGIQRGGVDKLLAINSFITVWGSELRQYMFNVVFKYLTSKPCISAICLFTVCMFCFQPRIGRVESRPFLCPVNWHSWKNYPLFSNLFKIFKQLFQV